MRINKPTKDFSKLTKAKARLIAHLIGDGAHYKTKHDYVLKYEVRDEESLNQFNDDIIEVYGLKPYWEWNKSGITGKPIKFVRLRSKIAYEDLLKYSTYFSKDWKIKSEILKSKKSIKVEFLRALFDDEGSVRSKKEVFLYSINKDGLLQIKEILNEFEMESVIKSGFGQKKNVYALSLNGQEFKNKIGFGLKRKQEKL